VESGRRFVRRVAIGALMFHGDGSFRVGTRFCDECQGRNIKDGADIISSLMDGLPQEHCGVCED
jgi:hypothetical protein